MYIVGMGQRLHVLENTDLEYGYSQICYMYSHSFSSLRQKGLI